MSDFALRCGGHSPERQRAADAVLAAIESGGLGLVRVAWCDIHGITRAKALTPAAVRAALQGGVGMVSTLLLKDTSDRAAWPVFQPGGTADLPGFGQANNVVLLPDPASFRVLPWRPSTGWLRAQAWFADGRPVSFDSRRLLQRALQWLAARGYGLRCGLEVQFHIYRIADDDAQTDPRCAAWPGEPPAVRMIHPGYQLLSEAWLDQADAALRIVRQTAQGLGLPLSSLEAEMGPSQVEAVFDVTDALTAADNMVLFRNAVRMALREAGYHVTFMCRPPFAQIMASGWHMHQSLVDLATGANAMCRTAPAPNCTPSDARSVLSDAGAHYMAGLLAHARGMAVFCTPTANGYGRFRPHALAPQSVQWGRDNRGAMLRVIGGCGDAATRIENRIGEPAANPYLYPAAQIEAGQDGLERGLLPPPATEDPYGSTATPLPTSLGEALDALDQDTVLAERLGQDWVAYIRQIKGLEWQRYTAAEDSEAFERREYFSRL
ncbi:glutamine synthetase family protein [Tepidimonas sp.]|uniref:glutamine synthetase family protein n=1 Tax=Tepidimonas sp. TaxID=2002775 RepID=UPI002FE1AE31